jgi:hypothetical protein
MADGNSCVFIRPVISVVRSNLSVSGRDNGAAVMMSPGHPVAWRRICTSVGWRARGTVRAGPRVTRPSGSWMVTLPPARMRAVPGGWGAACC